MGTTPGEPLPSPPPGELLAPPSPWGTPPSPTPLGNSSLPHPQGNPSLPHPPGEPLPHITGGWGFSPTSHSSYFPIISYFFSSQLMLFRMPFLLQISLHRILPLRKPPFIKAYFLWKPPFHKNFSLWRPPFTSPVSPGHHLSGRPPCLLMATPHTSLSSSSQVILLLFPTQPSPPRRPLHKQPPT